MKKTNLIFIIASCFQVSIGMQQNRAPEQLVQQALAELPKIREELGRPVNPNQGQLAQGAPHQPSIDVHKRRLQGAPLNRVCAAISGGQDPLHAQRNVQEAIGHVVISTAAAQETALQERLEQKAVNLAHAELSRRGAEQELGILQEIKQKKEQQKVKTAEYKKACKDLELLREQKDLDDKLDQLTSHLSRLDFELTGEIMALQQILRTLKNS